MSGTIGDELQNSPIPSTVDKFREAHYFLVAMSKTYHSPHAFRYSLNAFIQALRNITFMLQSEPGKPASFECWYAEKQEDMRSDAQLRQFVEARNLIVKKAMLTPSSEAQIGLFRWRRLKLGFSVQADPFVHGRELLRRSREFCLKTFLDEEHSAIGEEAGVWRKWVVDGIGKEDAVSHCGAALRKLSSLVEEASKLWGTEFDGGFDVPEPAVYQVLTESDVDPGLLKKWEWDQGLEVMRRLLNVEGEPGDTTNSAR